MRRRKNTIEFAKRREKITAAVLALKARCEPITPEKILFATLSWSEIRLLVHKSFFAKKGFWPKNPRISHQSVQKGYFCALQNVKKDFTLFSPG